MVLGWILRIIFKYCIENYSGKVGTTVNEEGFKKFLGNERSEKTTNLSIAAITGVEAFLKNKGHFGDFGQVKISEIQDAHNAITEFSFQSLIHLQNPSAYLIPSNLKRSNLAARPLGNTSGEPASK